jgi:hypothetical protein
LFFKKKQSLRIWIWKAATLQFSQRNPLQASHDVGITDYLQEGFSNLLKGYLLRDSARGDGEDAFVLSFLGQLGVGADMETGPFAVTAQYVPCIEA